MAVGLRESGECRDHVLLEFRKTLVDCRPNDIRIDVEVAVNEMIAHPDDWSPRNPRMRIAE